MLAILTSFLTAKATAYIGGSIAAFVLAWIFKKIPNEKIKKAVGKLFYGLGVAVTLGLSKWKFTAGFWNKVIEPWFIDFIDNIFGEAIKKFIEGLRSDNK